MVNSLPPITREMNSILDWEDLEEEMADPLVFLPGESSWTEEPDGPAVHEVEELELRTHTV